MIILVAVVMVLFVREVHILVGIRKHTHAQAVHVVPVLAHVILVLPILEVTVQREIPEQVLVAVAVVATHQVAVVVILAVLVAVAVLHVVAAVVVLHVVLVVAIEDSL